MAMCILRLSTGQRARIVDVPVVLRRLRSVGMLWCVAAAPANAQTVRDSAGIRIVDSPRPLWKPAAALRLSDAPTLVIGSKASPEYTFGRIRHVSALSDGRIVVADGASKQLRFFDAQGVFLKAGAVNGTGPGQLRDMNAARRLRGDSMAISSGFRDVLVYSPHGEYVRTISTPFEDGGRRPPRLMSVDVLPNGTRVMVPTTNPASRAPGTT